MIGDEQNIHKLIDRLLRSPKVYTDQFRWFRRVNALQWNTVVRLWSFSNNTVEAVPHMTDDVTFHPYLEKSLPGERQSATPPLMISWVMDSLVDLSLQRIWNHELVDRHKRCTGRSVSCTYMGAHMSHNYSLTKMAF